MRDRILGAIVVTALLVTAWTESPHWLAAATRAAQRMTTPRALREKNEERVVVTQILEAMSAFPAGARATLALPSPPGVGDDATYLVYRLRVKLYPRALDVVFLDGGRWHLLDLDYGRTTAREPFADLPAALAEADVVVMAGGLAATVPGFADVTPPGSFGFKVCTRSRSR